MALQRMILVPPELWENRSQEPQPVKKIVKSKDHSYNKWTQVRLHHDPYLKTGKRKWEHIPIPIIETGSTNLFLKQNLIENVYLVKCLCLKQRLNQKQMRHLRIQSIFTTF